MALSRGRRRVHPPLESAPGLLSNAKWAKFYGDDKLWYAVMATNEYNLFPTALFHWIKSPQVDIDMPLNQGHKIWTTRCNQSGLLLLNTEYFVLNFRRMEPTSFITQCYHINNFKFYNNGCLNGIFTFI